MNDIGISLAIAGIKDDIDNKLPLEERIMSAMKMVRQRERDIFFMCYDVNDDLMLKTALGAVMTKGTQEDKDIIIKSLMPLRALNAAINGLPIDFSNVDMDGILPIVKMWNDSKS